MARQVLLIKYQLQQQMATKDGKRAETMALRSTRRSKTHELKENNNLEHENLVKHAESKDVHNHIEDHKEQQNNPKIEKQSNSPTNNEQQSVNIIDDISRRVTRSSIHNSKKMCSEVEMQKEPMTPEDNQISRVSEQPTTKKVVKALSSHSLQQNGCTDLIATVKKPSVKILETITSPYHQGRKSYRRIHKNEIISIPYRKCHDAFEGRIVSIINKIQAGKNCLRDFQSLVEKIQRISGKDMMNKYIIAGISTIIKLSKEKEIYDVTTFPMQKKLIQRLQFQEKKLRDNIIEEMDRIEAYDENLVIKNQEFIQSKEYKNLLIKKIYKIMKHTKSNKHNHCPIQMRKRAIQDCQKFFSCQANVGSLIKFVKLKTDLQQ